MSTLGLDYAWSHPPVSAMRSLGVRFVCRYLSHDQSKDLSRAEADRLSAAGIWIVVVWETTAKRALAGRAAGAADARDAAMQAKACGMPDGRPIYFAVDWDASAGQQDEINAYLDGAASVIGRDRVGLYAGYYPVKRALDAGKARWAWQTYAWSGGRWDGRAHIQQYRNGVTVGGADCDYDRAMKSDYGQWRVGVTPEGEDDVSAKDVWEYPIDTGDGKDPWHAKTVLGHLEKSQDRIEAKIDAGNAAVAELSKALAALAADRGQEIDADALIARIKAEIERVTVHLDVTGEETAS